MSQELVFTVTSADAGQRLDDWLLVRLTAYLAGDAGNLSKSKARRLVMAGAVLIRGQAIRHASQGLEPGMRVIVRFDRELLLAEKDAGDIVFELSAADIIFEDEWLIAVNKPAGLPTEATIVAGRDHLQAAVCRFLNRRDGTPEPYVAIHHRLDKDTSGVILFSKKKEANHGLHVAFEQHLAQKTYLALCRRPPRLPPAEFGVDNQLGRISPKSTAAKWGAVQQGGDRAITAFSLRQTGLMGHLVEARPHTGRTHQIRVHLAGLGLPLWGDELYGGPAAIAGRNVPRVMLHAQKLVLPHPMTGSELNIEAGLPPDFTQFLKLLDSRSAPAPSSSADAKPSPRPANKPARPRKGPRSH